MPKVKRIHLVCRDNTNVTERASGLFVSGYWKLGADVALGVEEVFLHQSRDVPSYRQGKIVERHLVPFENEKRTIFVCEPMDEGRAWEGQASGEKGYGY